MYAPKSKPKGSDAPAVGELSAHRLQVRVAHVLDGEDENVLEVVGGLLDIGKELLRQLLALLVRLGQVNDSGALRFGHGGGGVLGVVVLIDLVCDAQKKVRRAAFLAGTGQGRAG